MKKFMLLLCCILVQNSCKESAKNYYDSSGYNYENDAHEGIGINEEGEAINEDGDIIDYCDYNDGIYHAAVDYNNPDTDYSETYDLDVEVLDCEIVAINFPNGGYISCSSKIYDGEADVEEEGKSYHIYLD